jgi:hypothetical protein
MPQFVAVIFDNLSNDAKHLKTRLQDLVEFKARGNFEIVFSSNIDADLPILSNTYDYAVVVALGSICNTSQEIVDSVQYAQETNSPLIAHILEREPYYEFHPQWFVLNLKIYKELSFPLLDVSSGTTDLEVIDVVRSAENFHHSYTPHWIKPGTGFQNKSIPNNLFGFRLIDQLLRNGHTIHNVPQHIRDRKTFCYPENNIDELYRSMEDVNYKSPTLDAHFDWLVPAQRQNVYNGIGFYPANTEPIICYNNNLVKHKKFNYFAGVAGGFKPALLIDTELFEDTVQVVIVDYSDAALEWQKHLYNNWNGELESLEDLFDSFRSQFPHYNPIIGLQKSFTVKVKEILDEQGITVEQLKRAWAKYKLQKVEFRKIDLLDISTVESFAANLQDTTTSAYLWFSNVFYMDWQMFYYGKELMNQKLQNYYAELKNKCNAYITAEHCNILQVVRPND